MVTITLEAVDYNFTLVDQDITVNTRFDSGRWLNAGNEISVRLQRPACWIDGWPQAMRELVGKKVVISNLFSAPFEAVVADSTTSGTYYLGLVCHTVAHDERGQI